MADQTHKFVMWHNSYPSKIWTRIDKYLTADTKPKMLSNTDSDQAQFEVSVNDISYTDQLQLKTGDNICITTDKNCTGILNKKYLGKIHTRKVTINSFDVKDPVTKNRRKLKTQVLTVKQRDFSATTFQTNYTQVTSLETILNDVFGQFSRKDLGGVIGGVLMPKFILRTPGIEIDMFVFKGTLMQLLKELSSRLFLKFQIYSYCEPDEINGLNYCYQVEIWR